MNPSDLAAMYRSMGFPVPQSNALKPYRRPKYVKFAPGDCGEHLADVFFEGKLTEPLKILICVYLSPVQIHETSTLNLDLLGRYTHGDSTQYVCHTFVS